uniref:Hemerythrin-like domain-containing protein n=1 Tax=Magnetococcus massalia (strain MO-1) TaxID=451514 RepID=A0A1S7LET5_MAGMO|nr:conserved protein of unknown function [Include Hemerythrin-like metal binding domain] [Candidatus Magnetococcus massalia]
MNLTMVELGVPFMDAQHQAFVDRLTELADKPEAELLAAFPTLVSELESHFAQEEELMASCGFGAIGEHTGEHKRLLSECAMLSRFAKRGGAPAIIRFMQSELPRWFHTHLETMDAALAVHAQR